MRELILTILIPGGLIWGLFSARAATLVLLWIGFQRPFDFSWGLWTGAPVWQIAFAIALVSNIARKQFHPKCPAFLVIFLVFFAWITLTSFTGFSPERSWLFYSIYIVPLTLGMWVVAATINDLQMLKYCMWVTAGSLGINAVKVGISLGVSGGGVISSGSSGFIGDNNVFGLALCLTVAMLMGLRSTLPKKRWAQLAFFGGIFFVILTIIFTKSRGALLSIGVILFLASLLGGKPVRHLLALCLCAVLIYAVVPAKFFDRLDTLQNVDVDESAMGRIENWKLAWEGAVDNPILGIGLGNHMPYHNAIGANVRVRVAHSVYFQTLGELSFIGLALYLLMIFLTLFSLGSGWRRYSKLSQSNSNLLWLRNLYFWLFCGFAGYMLGSALLNMILIEFPWYTMLYIALLRRMSLQAETGSPANPVEATR